MIELDSKISWKRDVVGGKAQHLGELLALGLPVPPTAVVGIGEYPGELAPLYTWLEQILGAEPWKLAVRSSSATEDTELASKAGHFLSLLGEFDRSGLSTALARVRASGAEMAVIVQPLLQATVAGVLFSCDPLTYSREQMIVDWTTGLADQLVGGEEQGESLQVTNEGHPVRGVWPFSPDLLRDLLTAARTVQAEWRRPVDLEWVIDSESRLWIVQARPVVLPLGRAVALASETAFADLPSLVREHPKSRLRRHAVRLEIPMAPAIVEVAVDSPRDEKPPALGKCAGVSIVLLYPERVGDQVVREFAPVRGSDVEFFTKTCRRYSVRRYPKLDTVVAAKTAVHEAGLRSSWVSAVIVQAIWSAHATGIVHRSADGYLIEVALGHFVPKGIVPTSRILLNREKQVVSAVWAEQPTAYHFMDGHVVTETPPREQLRLDEETLARIAHTFDPLFDIYGEAVLEFGVLDGDDGPRVYLIDVAEPAAKDVNLNADLISSGVLSPGKCRGRLIRVELAEVGALDRHLHDRRSATVVEGEPVVILAERASVELLPYVGAENVVGFIFERGAILAHLCVVLREKGIPAILLNAADDARLSAGAEVAVDATSRALTASERVKVV